MIVAGYLGFALVHLHHDKLIHGLIFFFITIEVYFVFDTNNKSLKTLRLITFLTCTIFASTVLEIVQNVVNPSRIFDVYDIAFNMIGSVTGLITCIVIHSYIVRRNRQLRAKRSLRIDPEQAFESPANVLTTASKSVTPDSYVNIKLQDLNIHEVD